MADVFNTAADRTGAAPGLDRSLSGGDVQVSGNGPVEGGTPALDAAPPRPAGSQRVELPNVVGWLRKVSEKAGSIIDDLDDRILPDRASFEDREEIVSILKAAYEDLDRFERACHGPSWPQSDPGPSQTQRL